MNETRSRIRKVTRMGLSVALLCLCAWIALPFPVPVTMQSFGILFLCGYLGWRRAAGVYLAYLALGAVGLPVFAGFRNGAAVLAGPTAGFLLGFLAALPVMGWFQSGGSTLRRALGMAVGLGIAYAGGCLWYWRMFGAEGLAGLGGAVMVCVVPYVAPDLAKSALALALLARFPRPKRP